MDRITREKKTITKMITIYCEGNHETKEGLCDQCSDLLDYAYYRLDKCRYGNDKSTCANCPTHCYNKRYRDSIKEVMRYSGPRMIYRHPYLAIRHLLDGRKKITK